MMSCRTLKNNTVYPLSLALLALIITACGPQKRRTDFNHNADKNSSPQVTTPQTPTPGDALREAKKETDSRSARRTQPNNSGSNNSGAAPEDTLAGHQPSKGGHPTSPNSNETSTPPPSAAPIRRELKPIEIPQIVTERKVLHGENINQTPPPPFTVQAFLTIDLAEDKNEMRLDLTLETAAGKKERLKLAGHYVRHPGRDQPWSSTLYAVDESVKKDRRVQAVAQCPRKFVCDQVWLDIYYVINGMTYKRQVGYGQKEARLVLDSGETIPLPKADDEGYITIPDLSKVDVGEDNLHGDLEENGEDADDDRIYNRQSPDDPPPPRPQKYQSTSPRRVSLKDQTIVYDNEVSLPLPEESDYQVPGLALTQKTWRRQAIGTHSRGHLTSAIQMPASGRGYFIKENSLAKSWGADLTIELFKSIFASIAEFFPNRPDVALGNISRRNGEPICWTESGRTKCQKSHRTGLDVDSGFYHLSSRVNSFWLPLNTNMRGFDYERNWMFLKELHNTQQDHIIVIFLDSDIKKNICSWVNSRKIDISDPKSVENRALRYIKNYPGHKHHYHVRMNCPPAAPDCKQVDLSLPSNPCH